MLGYLSDGSLVGAKGVPDVSQVPEAGTWNLKDMGPHGEKEQPAPSEAL